MKKMKKAGVSIFTARGRNWYCSTSSRRYTDFAGATITRGIFILGPTRSGLSKNKQNTQFCRANYLGRVLEAGCLVV